MVEASEIQGEIYDDLSETLKDPKAFVERWLNEIELAEATQKDWMKQALDARDMFRSENTYDKQRFNIQFSNVQTMVPALYSNRPTPDVRKRFSDKHDRSGAARIASQIIERNLSACMDSYNFDGTMRGCVQDGTITGRGTPRVRLHVEDLGNGRFRRRTKAEIAQWKHILLGPCEVWDELPWLCFRHFFRREELIKLNPKMGGSINLDHTLDPAKDNEKADDAPNVFKRAIVFEIWDKASGQVIWIAPSSKDKPLKVMKDPLDLVDFWPIPEPYYVAKTTDTMVPIVPIKIIKPLVEELEEVTKRIQAITRVIKWRGFADPQLAIEALANADDGELVPAGEEILALVQSGGLEKHIWLMPIEKAIPVLKALYEQREQIKQVIFEVTGVSDIIRGATDPNETLGAQELKANFGTLRIQDQQKEVQRMVRDVLRIKADLMCSHFDIQDLIKTASMRLPTQVDKAMAQQQAQQMQQQAQEGAPPPQMPPELEEILNSPTVEEVAAVIKDDMVRQYVIDIETDSTIQQDMRQVQGNMSAFLEGTAKFLQAIGPIVQAGLMPAEIAVDLYQPFARSFHLGKQAEDALERLSDGAKEQKKKGDPNAEIARQEAERVKRELMEAEEKHKQAMAHKQQGHDMEMDHKRQTGAIEIDLKESLASIAARAKQQQANGAARD